MTTKYIRNQHRFLVFSDSIQHKDFADKVLRGKLIHGAGFMQVDVIDGVLTPKCFGESESLRKGPRRDCARDIVESIGMKEDSPTKYIIYRGKVVIFWHELSHEAVSESAFFGSIDCESAGFMTLSILEDGRVNIKCFGESECGMAKSREGDNKRIAELLGLDVDLLV